MHFSILPTVGVRQIGLHLMTSSGFGMGIILAAIHVSSSNSCVRDILKSCKSASLLIWQTAYSIEYVMLSLPGAVSACLPLCENLLYCYQLISVVWLHSGCCDGGQLCGVQGSFPLSESVLQS